MGLALSPGLRTPAVLRYWKSWAGRDQSSEGARGHVEILSVCAGDCPLSLESEGVDGYLMESPGEMPGEALRGTAEDLVCQSLQNP